MKFQFLEINFLSFQLEFYPYPITFLITDLISEIYGKKKANEVVVAGIFASFFSVGILLIANWVPALDNSPIDDTTFNQVFALSPVAVFASMIAYLLAQLVDIQIYHFWKDLTQGRMLWLRNNFSTFSSQLIDTVLVIGLLSIFGVFGLEFILGVGAFWISIQNSCCVFGHPFIISFCGFIQKNL